MVKIKKQYKEKYTVVLNTVLEDERLSYKAVGLFVDLWHSPDDWDYYLSEIVKRHTDGKDSVNSGLEELEKYGYLKKSNFHRNEKGRFSSYDWELSETPMPDQSGKPATDNNHIGKSTTENQPLQSTKRQSTEINKVDDDDVQAQTEIPVNKFNPFDWYFKAFGNHPNGIVIDDFLNYINHLGDEVVVEAIKRAGSRGKGWNYAQGMLNRWNKENVKGLDDIARLDKQHQSSGQRSFKRKSSAKKKVESYGQGEYAIEKAKADRGEIPF